MAKPEPVHKIRFGRRKAAIWKNETDNGTFYNVTFQRSYKNGENWKDTESFGRDDLLVVAKLADEAHSWIYQQQQ